MPDSGLVKGDLTAEQKALLLKHSELAVDCEMMGLNPFRDRLCVVQITAENLQPFLIQIDEKEGAPNLKAVMEDETVTKIFHFARIDTLFLQMRLGIDTKNIFCTKIASKIGRTYTDKHGLRELVKEFTQENLDKSNQSSDWGRETLTQEQLQYARGDVKYLFRIRRELTTILKRESRYDLYSSVASFLPVLRKLDSLGYEDPLAF